jgi:hypothetical protein
VLNPDTEITVRELAENIEVAKDTAWSIQKKIKGALVLSPQLVLALDKDLNKHLNKHIYGKE